MLADRPGRGRGGGIGGGRGVQPRAVPIGRLQQALRGQGVWLHPDAQAAAAE